MSSTFGTLFRCTTFGESHGDGVGVIVDGCPSLLPLRAAEIQSQLDRRRPGQSAVATPRVGEQPMIGLVPRPQPPGLCS